MAENDPLSPRSPVLGSHIPALDAIRGLAILLVMLYHFNDGPDDPTLLGSAIFKLFRLGGCGVDLFFVLSGFLITGILFDSKNTPHYFRNFYIRRTLRIFPLYYGVLFFTFVVLPLASRSGESICPQAEQHQAWLWLYATNLLQAWKESDLLGGFHHFWSLAVEEHFYLVWPLVIFLCDRRRGMQVCVGCTVLALACRIGLVVHGNHPIATYVLTPCRIDGLAVGAFLALAIRAPGGLDRLKASATFSVVAATVLCASVLWWKRDLSSVDGWVLVVRFSLQAWLFGGLLIRAISASPAGLAGHFWNSRSLRFFGEYSYGLYVFHHPLVPYFRRLFPPEYLATRFGSVFLGRALYMLLATGASLALALLSWHLYEKHFLKLKSVLTPHRPSTTAGRRCDSGWTKGTHRRRGILGREETA
ncbi:MAG: acyltransferase [Planctomycetes bacterium]|nr:acyltransferase [Planctomycetota bacterium]